MNEQPYSYEALNNQKEFYDSRFKEGYMQDFSGLFESCRFYAMQDIFKQIKSSGFKPATILDYGCGEGRYINLLKDFFPTSALHGCDISDEALAIAKNLYSSAQYTSMTDEAVNLPDNSFDLVISIEVLEHVGDVARSLSEIGRLLKPQGLTVLSTPCANEFSFEWWQNRLTGGLQPSFDGYGRFKTDEPGHLRRLNDRHLKSLCSEVGIDIYKIYHRAHLFETLAPKGRLFKRIPQLCVGFGMLDWYLFKNFPNGSTMIALGKKR